MVRGRRVRAVVACTKNDDCCSPNAKRKDQKKLLNGNLNQILAPENKSHNIKEYFQAVVDSIDTKPVPENIDSHTTPLKQLRSSRFKPCPIGDKIKLENDEFEHLNGLNDVTTEIVNSNNIPTTPIISKLKVKSESNSPPTPHRIELRAEPLEDIKKEEKIEVETKTEEPKPHRRCQNNYETKNDVKKHAEKINNNHKLTEFFPIRRSGRKSKKTVEEEKQRSLEQALKTEKEEGLEIRDFEEKGRGIVASKNFQRGDFVVEYKGDLLYPTEAKKREEKYALDQNTGCYMYYFKHAGQQYCIDATAESGKLGRLVNHSRNGNLSTRILMVNSKPRLVLIANVDINAGEEVLYDYGDRSKESLKHHPWLAY